MDRLPFSLAGAHPGGDLTESGGKRNELRTVEERKKSSGFQPPWRLTGLGPFVSLHGL